jgi:hypothetical protein
VALEVFGLERGAAVVRVEPENGIKQWHDAPALLEAQERCIALACWLQSVPDYSCEYHRRTPLMDQAIRFQRLNTGNSAGIIKIDVSRQLELLQPNLNHH